MTRPVPRQLPDIVSLRLLVLIADLGSIGAGAAAAGVSQPSASKRIRLLEQHLGIALLERGARGSQLTEHGRTVTGWARAVVEAARTLVVGARALHAGAAGGVSTAASQTIAEYLFPHWLAKLRDQSISVRLRVVNSAGVIELVRARDVELGFVETPIVPRDLASHVVATDRLVVVVAPGHPLARRRSPVSARELAATRLVMREGGSGTRATLERALRGQTQTYLELDSNAAVKVIVSSGTGAAVLSTLAVAAELADGRLVEVPTRDLDLRRPLRAVWPRGRRLVGAAAEFLAATR
jgi:DNA-binding transcriptional LysR family regulator